MIKVCFNIRCWLELYYEVYIKKIVNRKNIFKIVLFIIVKIIDNKRIFCDERIIWVWYEILSSFVIDVVRCLDLFIWFYRL